MSKLMILNDVNWLIYCSASICIHSQYPELAGVLNVCSFFSWNYVSMMCHKFHGTVERWNSDSSMNSVHPVSCVEGCSAVIIAGLGMGCLCSSSEISWSVCMIRLLYCRPAGWFASTTMWLWILMPVVGSRKFDYSALIFSLPSNVTVPVTFRCHVPEISAWMSGAAMATVGPGYVFCSAAPQWHSGCRSFPGTVVISVSLLRAVVLKRSRCKQGWVTYICILPSLFTRPLVCAS
jgi:hypothetical protein